MVQVGPRGSADLTPAPARSSAPAVRERGAGPEARRRRYTVEIPFDPELLPFLALMAVGLVLRVWDLGAKALHHDESLHAVYSWYLYQGRGYTHDPMMHGPFLFEANALVYLLFGANDVTARLLPALFGTALIGLPWFVRRELGLWGAVAAAALFTISPDSLYFSRFLRQDIYVDVFTFLIMIGVFRYLATGRRRWFYTAVVAATLLYATKESFFISGVIPFTFLLGSWFLLRGEARSRFWARVRALGWESWAIGLVVFLAVNLVMYTTFFTNLRGVCTAVVTLPLEGCAGTRGALNYWFEQQDFARGGQPWFYYLMMLGLYEFLPLGLGVLALLLVKPKTWFFWFTVYWFLSGLLIYSWAGEKMPWMTNTVALPLILVAGRLLGDWAEAGWGRRALSPRGLAVAGVVLLAALGLAVWVGLGAARVVAPVELQSITLQRLALSVLIAAAAFGLVALWTRWGRSYALPGIALGLLAIFAAGYLRTALRVSYEQPDTPNEPLIYVQSSPDVVWVSREIERVANQTGQGKSLPILLDGGWGDGVHESVAWPFEWYLRDYKNRRYFSKTIDPSINLAEYPVILTMVPNVEPIQDQLREYTVQKYRLNWWFPEDYKLFAGGGPTFELAGRRLELPWLRFDRIGATLADPQNGVRLLKFLLYREPPNELGAREFYFGVSTSIPQLGPGPVGIEPAPGATGRSAGPSQPRQAVAQQPPDGSTVFGRSAEGVSILSDPKGAAVGADGKLYVVEGKAARVTVFNPDGTLATTWGGPGQAEGQFQEPWGVAVAPNGDVYVADTWNHRVQRFDPAGRFLGTWGRLGDAKGRIDGDQGVFWGPRAIAISPQGEVFVTDTGNKRVQVFGLDGSFRRMFGGEGDQPGQLREPVGIALDREGNLWVADAWNSRIQKLDQRGRPLAQLAVPAGWENPSITNKPYLAVDGQGQIVASFPDLGRVLTFSPADGRVAQQYQVPQNGSAVGVATGPDGRSYVVDARNGVVIASRPAP